MPETVPDPAERAAVCLRRAQHLSECPAECWARQRGLACRVPDAEPPDRPSESPTLDAKSGQPSS